MRVLIIEDEENIQKLLHINLTHENFTVLSEYDGKAGLVKAQKELPNLIILDINLPSMNGIDVCKQLKNNNRTKHIPVIMLSVRREEIDRVLGLEIGADDYVTKPFSPRELMLRIKSILKRYNNTDRSEAITFCDVTLNPSSFEVSIDGTSIELTPKEFQLLQYLITNKDRVVSRDTLLRVVWGYSTTIATRTIDAHIKSLRKKIISNKVYIKTIIGIGYKLTANV